MQIIDGQQLATEINQRTAREIFNQSPEQRPGLAIILAGQRPDSELYVKLKEQKAKEVGIDTHLYKIKNKETTDDILELIKFLNQDPEINGILIQLPLPDKYDTDKIISAIAPQKDVDCFHPTNVQKLRTYQPEKEMILPPVYGAVLLILEKIYFIPTGQQALVLANSDLFGQGLKDILETKEIKVSVAKPSDKDLKNKIKQADLLITALGKKHFIKGDMIKPNAVVIDIGIVREGGKVYGDVDFAEAKEMSSAITPVPGGIGPLTIAKVLENTWRLTKQQRGLK